MENANKMKIAEDYIPKRARKMYTPHIHQDKVLNIYKKILQECADHTYSDMLTLVSERSDVVLVSVQRIIDDYRAKKCAISSPNTSKILIDVYSNFHKNRIRHVVHKFWYKQKFPSVQKVLKTMTEDKILCSVKQTSIYRTLRELKFDFSGTNINCIIMDKLTIWRHKYLKDLKNYRKEGRKIYYLGETLYNVNDELSPDSMVKHYERGVPLMAAYIGSNTGFVVDSLMVFEPEIINSDYHLEFDSDKFFPWFVKVLSLLDDNSVIVMNDTPYHYLKEEKFPTIMWKKEKIIQWFESKNIPIGTDDIELKAELLKKVKLYKTENAKCMIEEHAKAQNKTVLRLPPYHTNLNPMELFWTMVKSIVTNGLILSDEKQFDKDMFVNTTNGISPEYWLTCIESAKAKEQFFWKINSNMEKMMETIDTSKYDIGNL